MSIYLLSSFDTDFSFCSWRVLWLTVLKTDPFCADQNACALIEAFWAEPDPMHPSKPLPTAPGIVWMLGGMNVVRGKVAYGRNEKSQVTTGQTPEEEVINMTPHIMILPLAIDPAEANLPSVYDPNKPLRQWVMAVGTPIAHLHVHFSDLVHKALMSVSEKSDNE